GDNGFVFIHAIISYFLFVCSVILNAIVFVLVKSSRKINDFRYVFYTYCVTNIIFSVVFSMTLMQWSFSPGLVVYFPTGPFANDTTITPVLFRIQTLVYLFVMCLVCATFIYRFLVVTRPNVSRMRARALSSLSFLPVTLWFADTGLIEHPNAQLSFEQVYLFASEIRVGLQIRNNQTAPFQTIELDLLNITRFFLTIVQINVMNAIVIWTGIRIFRTIQKSAGSQRSHQIERNAFRLLLWQAINPMILLHAPTLLNLVQEQLFEIPDLVNRVSCITMNVFTVTNPILNIIFTRDLRLGLSRRKKSSVSLSQF
ncbi:hypothetical protein PENTCL1PPCAC_21968, partial [Pristionchus entomophagus]